MKKKTENPTDEIVGARFEPLKIIPLEHSDLNTLKDKLNEVIAYLNAL